MNATKNRKAGTVARKYEVRTPATPNCQDCNCRIDGHADARPAWRVEYHTSNPKCVKSAWVCDHCATKR